MQNKIKITIQSPTIAEIKRKVSAFEILTNQKPEVYAFGNLQDVPDKGGLWIHGGKIVEHIGTKYLTFNCSGETVKALPGRDVTIVLQN